MLFSLTLPFSPSFHRSLPRSLSLSLSSPYTPSTTLNLPTSQCQILLTHHVKLALLGTLYLIRMLDGRIDTQGTVASLRSQGILEEMKQESEVQAMAEEQTLLPSTAADT